MPWLALAIAVAYLTGSLSGGLLLGRLAGVDLRGTGSGNVGATNAVRALGPLLGVAVFAFDAGKGAVATALVPRLGTAAWLPAACAAAAVIGHVFPVWFRFRGGKGFATALGAIAVLSPLALAPIAGVWVLLLVLTGYVSVATLCAVSAYPLFALAQWRLQRLPVLVFAAALALFLFYTHRDNLRRLARGDEHRFRRVWLFGHGRR